MPDSDDKIDDSKWVTAPSSQPLVVAPVPPTASAINSTPTPLQGTPSTPNSTPTKVWSGEMYQTPQTIFDDTFDADLLEEFSSRAPSFEMLVGRFDPFELDRLRPLIEETQYSTFINRNILTFRDTLEHAFQLAMFWRAEDDSVVKLSQEQIEANLAPCSEIEEAENSVEVARLAWKNAVAQRDKAFEDWNNYVAEFRLRYQIEKRKLKKK